MTTRWARVAWFCTWAVVFGACESGEPVLRDRVDASAAAGGKDAVSAVAVGVVHREGGMPDAEAECDPKTTRCAGKNFWRCGAHGDWELVERCQYECDARDGCSGDCITGALRCAADGGKIERCEGGVWRAAERCQDDKPFCHRAGGSVACVACSPGSTRCHDDVRQVCEIDGSSWSDRPRDACGSCGGVLRCDGSCSKATPERLGTACGSCGGRVQCDGSCSVPTPANFGMACGPCGGLIQCDGSCTVPQPKHQGEACGPCGGVVQCDGSCSVVAPADHGISCGACGGVVQCDGSCSPTPPAGYGAACGSCGGVVQCDGSCSAPTPADLGQACGTCGGVVQCGGACSVATPADFGQACGMCGGTMGCTGCSVETPANFGAIESASDIGDSGIIIGGVTGSGSGIDAYDPVFFRNCPRGYRRTGEPQARPTDGRVRCDAEWASSDPTDCRVRVNFTGNILEVNISCELTISYQRGCD